MRDAIVNPVVEGNYNQAAVPLAPNGTPIADFGTIGGSIGEMANAAAAGMNEATQQAVAEASEAIEENQKQAGRLLMYAIAGVIGFFVLREMKVI